MSRKAISIDLESLGPLRKTVIAVTRYMPFDGKVELTTKRIVALKGTAHEIARQSIAEYAQATIELFGKEDYEINEIQAIQYLRQF